MLQEALVAGDHSMIQRALFSAQSDSNSFSAPLNVHILSHNFNLPKSLKNFQKNLKSRNNNYQTVIRFATQNTGVLHSQDSDITDI